MYKYKITPIGSLVNIRGDHSTTSADIGDLLNGHYAEGDVLYETADKSQKWLNIASLDGQPKSGWCAVFYNGSTLCTLTENTVTPPPPPPAGHHIEVVIDGVVEWSKDF